VGFRALPVEATEVQTLTTEQSDRETKNADYQWLLTSLATLDAVRQEKTLSLNLTQRQQERVKQDQERLTEENTRRSADGQPPLKSVDDINVANQPDVILQQAADIMADEVASQANPNPPRVVQRAQG